MAVLGLQNAGALGILGAVALAAGTVGPFPPATSVATASPAPTTLYVEAQGSATGPCTQLQPCSELSRAVYVADHRPFDEAPITIVVGAGTYGAHLDLPDAPYPEPSLTIEGSSPARTILTAAGNGTVLTASADAPRITLAELTVTGERRPLLDGGNIMDVTDVTFLDNSPGGALDDDGGVMTVIGSTFSGNSVRTKTQGGGAIAQTGGKLDISGSLFTANTVSGQGSGSVASGGAIYVEDGEMHMSASTVTGNTAGAGAGGAALGLVDTSKAVVVGSTINDNTAAGPAGLVLLQGDSTISLGGDILVDDSGLGGTTCSGGKVVDLGWDLALTTMATSCSMNAAGVFVANAGTVDLRPLAYNGGPTKTERLPKTSVAVDAVPSSFRAETALFCTTEDQRGTPRLQGGAAHCDIGAYQHAPPVIMSIAPTSGAPNSTFTVQGYGFSWLDGVTMGGKPLSFSVQPTGFMAYVPDLPAGSADLHVWGPDGSADATFKVLPVT